MSAVYSKRRLFMTRATFVSAVSLAVLTLNAGRVVTMSALAEELWGDRLPQNVASALQTHVLHLRNRLASETPGAPHRTEVIRTMFGGYLLDPSSCQVDVEEFERLARAGRAAAEKLDPRDTVADRQPLPAGRARCDEPHSAGEFGLGRARE